MSFVIRLQILLPFTDRQRDNLFQLVDFSTSVILYTRTLIIKFDAPVSTKRLETIAAAVNNILSSQ